MIDVIRKIYDDWFLSEPALHAILCTHRLVENASMPCAMRTGSGRIEFNPNMVSSMPSSAVDELLRIEVIRILLGHPYKRQPVGVPLDILTLASDITITNYYDFDDTQLDTARQHNLPADKYYEWYAHELMGQQGSDDGKSDSQYGEGAQHASPRVSSGDDDASRAAQSELWSEDELAMAEIVRTTSRITQWGSLPQPFVDYLMASRDGKADYRRVLARFRQSALSSHRRLTRMRPNRRTDLLQMGSIYQMQSRVLVAVDTSGSISDADISRFYGIVGNLFRHYSTVVDVVQFDVSLSEVVSVKKAPRHIVVTQRGGTSFQPVIDFVSQGRSPYDGLMVLTDGMAPQPSVPKKMHMPVVWVLVESSSNIPDWLAHSLHCMLPAN